MFFLEDGRRKKKKKHGRVRKRLTHPVVFFSSSATIFLKKNLNNSDLAVGPVLTPPELQTFISS